MSDYTKLVKALRYCGNFAEREGCAESCEYFNDMDCPNRIMSDAAAAIAELQAEVKRLKLSCADCEYGNSPWPEEPVHEPKRGEWIKHPEVKNIYGGVYIECPFCGEKYIVQNVSDEKFCRNCGADMRAKMEVQDADT